MTAHAALALLAWRTLWRHPAFVVVASLTLALGMGAIVAAATLVDALLVGPSAYVDEQRLVVYGQQLAGGHERSMSPAAFAAIGVPDGMLARGMIHVPATVNVLLDGRAVLARARRIDAGFLPTLGLGSSRPGAWVSVAFWQRHGAPGNDLRKGALFVDGAPLSVAGVLPPGFRFFGDIDLLLPAALSASVEPLGANDMAIARLAPGVSASAFGNEVVRRMAARPEARLPRDRVALFGATPLREAMTAEARKPVLMFLACALVQLAIAGINTCNLIRGRSLGRAYDLAVRDALGAPGGARWIPACVDALVLWALATAGGLLLGSMLVTVLATFLPDDWRVSAFAVVPSLRVHLMAWLVCLGVVMVATLVAQPGVRGAEAARARMSVDGWPAAAPPARFARGIVVMVQAMLATALLLPSLSATAHLKGLERQAPGFDGASAIAMPLSPDGTQFPTLAGLDDLYGRLRSRMLAMPGIRQAGFATRLPVGDGFRMQFRDEHGGRVMYQYAALTPGAGEAMGLSKTDGRWLSDEDRAGAPAVAMVNEAYVRAMHGRGVGDTVQQVSRLFAPSPMRIVGVVADTYRSGDAHRAEPMVFVPFAQVDASSFAYIRPMLAMYAILRGPSADAAAGQRVRELLQSSKPYLATGDVRLLSGLARTGTDAPRRLATLLALFALPAVLLVGMGLYSVQAIEARSRWRDVALCQALGATWRAVLTRLFRPAMAMAGLGVLAGLVVAWLARAWWPADACHATAVSASVVAMLIVTLAATIFPAIGVLSIPPHHVLRGPS